MRKMVMSCCIMIASVVLADFVVVINGYTWTYLLSEGRATITGVTPRPTGSLTIPSTIAGCTVESIGDNVFQNCAELTDIKFAAGMKRIGRQAFFGCSGLNTIIVPEGMQHMGYQAFKHCPNIKAIHVDSLYAWCQITFGSQAGNPMCESGALLYTNGIPIVDVVIPNGLSQINSKAFNGGRLIKSVSIPPSVKSIGWNAFAGCGLTNVIMSSMLTEIGRNAFGGCESAITRVPASKRSFENSNHTTLRHGVNSFSKEIFEKTKDALVIVKCGNGQGSGFICKMDDRIWLITNEHVTRPGGSFFAHTYDGRKVSMAKRSYIEVATNRDLVRIPIDNEFSSFLEIDNGSPSIGDWLCTFGNSDGSGVLTSLEGKILGLGYDKVEVSIPFVQGNSGGAMLNSSGKVVGVVTYAMRENEPNNWVKTGTRFNEVRRFGVRFVDVKWEQLQWDDYSVRAKAIGELNAYIELLIPICFKKENQFSLISESDANKLGRFTVAKKFNRCIRSVARADEGAASVYQKIKRLRNGTTEMLKEGYLYGDLDNKWLKMVRTRLDALNTGLEFAKKSDWRLSCFQAEAKEISIACQFFIDKFRNCYEADLRIGN